MKQLFCIFICLTLSLSSQEVQQYPFIHYDLNKICYAKDSSKFMNLFRKMDSVERKEKTWITVAHIGGSHVQGGVWSSTFIGNLRNELRPDGGGYFIFPYKIAKTNSPHFASSFTTGKWKKCRCVTREFCLPLGMCGMSVTNNDSACEFGIALTKRSSIDKFTRVRVYHTFNPSFEFFPCKPQALVSKRTDMPEKGYTLFELDSPVDSICFQLIRKDTLVKDFTLFGFSLEQNASNGIYYASLGANGATSNSYLRCNYFSEQLNTIKPDLFILSLGVNDTQGKNFEKDDYIENYDSLIRKIRAVNPDAAILLTTTTDNFIKRKTANKRPLKAQEAMYELSTEHNVAVWDLYNIMGGYKSMLKWQKLGLASKDRVHFSNKGYTIIGDLMAEALINSYRYSYKKKQQ